MGRADIANYGKRFSSEYQPAGRGRPKGSRNARTIFREFCAAQADPLPADHIAVMLDLIFGKRRAKRYKRGAVARVSALKLPKPKRSKRNDPIKLPPNWIIE